MWNPSQRDLMRRHLKSLDQWRTVVPDRATAFRDLCDQVRADIDRQRRSWRIWSLPAADVDDLARKVRHLTDLGPLVEVLMDKANVLERDLRELERAAEQSPARARFPKALQDADFPVLLQCSAHAGKVAIAAPDLNETFRQLKDTHAEVVRLREQLRFVELVESAQPGIGRLPEIDKLELNREVAARLRELESGATDTAYGDLTERLRRLAAAPAPPPTPSPAPRVTPAAPATAQPCTAAPAPGRPPSAPNGASDQVEELRELRLKLLDWTNAVTAFRRYQPRVKSLNPLYGGQGDGGGTSAVDREGNLREARALLSYLTERAAFKRGRLLRALSILANEAQAAGKTVEIDFKELARQPVGQPEEYIDWRRRHQEICDKLAATLDSDARLAVHFETTRTDLEQRLAGLDAEFLSPGLRARITGMRRALGTLRCDEGGVPALIARLPRLVSLRRRTQALQAQVQSATEQHDRQLAERRARATHVIERHRRLALAQTALAGRVQGVPLSGEPTLTELAEGPGLEAAEAALAQGEQSCAQQLRQFVASVRDLRDAVRTADADAPGHGLDWTLPEPPPDADGAALQALIEEVRGRLNQVTQALTQACDEVCRDLTARLQTQYGDPTDRERARGWVEREGRQQATPDADPLDAAWKCREVLNRGRDLLDRLGQGDNELDKRAKWLRQQLEERTSAWRPGHCDLPDQTPEYARTRLNELIEGLALHTDVKARRQQFFAAKQLFERYAAGMDRLVVAVLAEKQEILRAQLARPSPHPEAARLAESLNQYHHKCLPPTDLLKQINQIDY